LEPIKGEETIKESLPSWKKALSVPFSKQREDPQKRIRDMEHLLGKKEVEIALLKNFLGQGSEINFRFRSASVWRKRRWPGVWILITTSSLMAAGRFSFADFGPSDPVW